MVKSSIPFVGLHAHSTAGSPFDAIGFPQQHMDFAYQNGSDALALTDHGNCNGLAYQVLHAKSMEKEGKEKLESSFEQTTRVSVMVMAWWLGDVV